MIDAVSSQSAAVTTMSRPRSTLAALMGGTAAMRDCSPSAPLRQYGASA